MAGLRRPAVIALSMLAASAVPGGARAQDEQPVELTADRMIYERELGIVTAKGNVEIQQGERTLFADTVTYNERDDVVTASGEVVLHEPSGDVLFADYVELTDNFKQGVIEELKVRRADRSRLSAKRARREGEDRMILERAIYTRCEICPEHPDRPPIWQFKSGKVTRDRAAEIVEYEDTMFEMFGVPVFYTPYFYHPDPSVKRKSGLLTPLFGSSTELGPQLTLPVYWVIDENKDFTFSPRMTAKEGAVFGGEYRQAFDSGRLDLEGSLTYVDEIDANNLKTGNKEFRGHVHSIGRFKIDRDFDWGFDIFRSSDDTYLKRYDITGESTLTSNVYLEGVNGRNHTGVDLFSFQGLRIDDDQGDIPFVMPLVSYTASGEPSIGGRIDATLGGVALQRTGGRDTRRLSFDGSWTTRHIGPIGDLVTLGVHLRGDGYMVSEAQLTDPTASSDNLTEGRVWPMATAMWSLPMVRDGGNLTQTIEPIVQLVASPAGGNPNDIPNEDSQSFEFSEANLFSRNRFAGYDRVESGSRINYGIRFGLYGRGGGQSNLLIGQSIRLNENSAALAGTGLEDRLSDIVGGLTVAPSSYLDYTFRFRVDPDAPTLERHEHTFSGGDDRYRLNVGFVSYSPLPTSVAEGNVKELNTSGIASVTDYWKVFGGYRRDLSGGGSIRAEGGIRYLDECFDFSIGVARDFTSDRDAEESTSVFVRFELLGLN